MVIPTTHQSFKLKAGKSHGVFSFWKLFKFELDRNISLGQNHIKEYFFDVETTHNLSISLDEEYKVRKYFLSA